MIIDIVCILEWCLCVSFLSKTHHAKTYLGGGTCVYVDKECALHELVSLAC